MACLSIMAEPLLEGDDPFFEVLANPIFVLEQSDLAIKFEIMVADTRKIIHYANKTCRLYMDETGPFWAHIQLRPIGVSTHRGLAGLRGRLAMEGMLTIIPEEAAD